MPLRRSARPASSPRPLAAPPDFRLHLLLALTLGLLAVVLIPCVVSYSPNPYWDMDPASRQALGPSLSLTPAATAWLQAAGLALAAAALALYVIMGGTIAWGSGLLAGAGIAACLWHLPTHVDNLTRAGHWIAAVALGVTAYHLSRLPRLRPWMIAGLIAMVIPMALKAIHYVFIEHPATVRYFQEHQAEILSAHGWAPGSPLHLSYEHRLHVTDAIGPFSALANVFASIMAALSLAAAGLAAGLLNRRRFAAAAVPGAVVGLGLLAVGLTHSRGAVLALLLVAGVVLAWGGIAQLFSASAHAARRWALPALRGRFLPVSAILLIALALAAVLVRGQFGPPAPGEPGERSLLFRAYYWQGTARLLADSPPTALLTGVGPGRFAQAYRQYKDPLSPEDILSTHNVFLDYVTMLGAGGLAWSVLLLLWLWRSGWAAALPPADTPAAGPPRWQVASADVLRILVLAVLVFGTQLLVTTPALLEVASFLMWAAGVMAFLGVAGLLVTPGWLEGRFTQMGLFAAAALLLVHNQIEMTFHAPGAATVAWFLLGIAAGGVSVPRPSAAVPEAQGLGHGRSRSRLPWHTTAFFLPALLAVGAVAWVGGLAIPLTRQELALQEAAQARRDDDPARTLAALHAATLALPTDPRPYQWQVRFLLGHARDLAREDHAEAASAAFQEALAALDRARGAGLDDLGLLTLRAQVEQLRFAYLRNPLALGRALAAYREHAARAPADWQTQVSLGDLLWQTGDRPAAAAAYARALELSRLSYLDPLTQMPAEEAKRLGARLQEAGGQ